MDLSQLQGTDDTLRAITNITQLLHQAVDEAVPLRVPRKAAAPWWNHSLTLAKKSVKRADQRARLQPTAENPEDSQYKCSKWSTMVRNAKTAYRVHQLETVSTRTVWRTIKHHNTHIINRSRHLTDNPTFMGNVMCCGKRFSLTQHNERHSPRISSPLRMTYATSRVVSLHLRLSWPLCT